MVNWTVSSVNQLLVGHNMVNWTVSSINQLLDGYNIVKWIVSSIMQSVIGCPQYGLLDRQLNRSVSCWLATIWLTGPSAQTINQSFVGHNMVNRTVNSMYQSVIGWPQYHDLTRACCGCSRRGLCRLLFVLLLILLYLKRIQNFTNPQLQKLVTSKALPPGF